MVTYNGFVATLTINHPENLNALSSAVIEEIHSALSDIECHADIRVVIITGSGKSFVAGADIAEMSKYSADEGKEFGKKGSELFRRIENFTLPVIAAVNGFALGGGCELALACDLRIASEKAKFGQPEVGLGITPGFSGTQRLPRIIGQAKAKELIYTANIIRADEALAIGLVNKVVDAENLMKEALDMANVIAEKAPKAVQYAKQSINMGIETDIETGIRIEQSLFGLCFATEDQKNGMQAFLKKEKCVFNGK